MQLVIVASSLGTVVEWYDFFIYGTLAGLFGSLFFPSASPGAGFLLALATFGVGFAVRPIGAIVFGHMGDRFGRKYTFLVTMSLMGLATAAIGVLPTFRSVGVLAPALLVTCRALQGFALGGEYGGASIYVAEHAPTHRRGAFTSFIQAGVPLGLLLSLVASMTTHALVGDAAWEAWGWRIPFLASLALLGVSLWIRLRLTESPVFQANKDAGRTARNPLKESLHRRGMGRMGVAFVVTCGQAVGAYTALFQSLYFLEHSLHVEPTLARFMVMAATAVAIGLFTYVGWLSDRIGRRRPLLLGFGLSVLCLFPLFHLIARNGNPALVEALSRSPVVVTGRDCAYNPFAAKGQTTHCGQILDLLSKNGVAYSKVDSHDADTRISVGGNVIDANDASALVSRLQHAGFSLDTVHPAPASMARIVLALIGIYALAALTYGPLAALLVELFPTRTRYTSLSIPYHVANGYAGGFLPFVSQYIVVKTGDPFAGVWYPVAFAAVAFTVALVFLPETAGKSLD